MACADGSVLLVEIERKTVTRVSATGAVSIVAQLDGGPNGAAVGPDGALYVCNNGGFLFQASGGINRPKPGVPEGYAGGWIERIDLATGARRTLYTHCGEHRLVGPNDIVFDRLGGFYFTDFGKMYPRHRMNGGLYYALADGSRIVEVAYPMVIPNGVGAVAGRKHGLRHRDRQRQALGLRPERAGRGAAAFGHGAARRAAGLRAAGLPAARQPGAGRGRQHPRRDAGHRLRQRHRSRRRLDRADHDRRSDDHERRASADRTGGPPSSRCRGAAS